MSQQRTDHNRKGTNESSGKQNREKGGAAEGTPKGGG